MTTDNPDNLAPLLEDPASKCIAELRHRIFALEHQIGDLEDDNRLLTAQLASLEVALLHKDEALTHYLSLNSVLRNDNSLLQQTLNEVQHRLASLSK